MSAFKYQWNQTIDVGTAGLSKQWTSIRHILSLLVTANACVHVTAYVAVRRSLSTTYTAVVLGLLLRQYVSYQFGVWAEIIMMSWHGDVFRVTGLLWGESTGHRWWVPLNKWLVIRGFDVALMHAWTWSWANNQVAGDLRRQDAHVTSL